MELLKLYGTELTEMAKQGNLDPIIGRQNEIDKTLQILCKMKRNNPCLVGDPGVGKSAIVEGLAQQLAKATAPIELKGKQVFALDMARVITACAEDLSVIMGIVHGIEQTNGAIILFIDEISAVLGAVVSYEAFDGVNLMKYILAIGEIKCILSTTPDEYSRYVEKDSSLRSQFQVVNVPELAVGNTIELLERSRCKYEQFHGVRYEFNALVAAARLSKKYLSDSFLPGKAIDLIDEAGSIVKLARIQGSNKKVMVTEEDVRQVVSLSTTKIVSDNMNKCTVRVFTKADPKYSLTIRDGKVILAPSDPEDEYQHWYKNYSSWAEDEFGHPAFSLVNKASGLAMEHSIGHSYTVGLIPFINPDCHGVSVLWTQGANRDGYRSMRMVNNIHLNVDAFYVKDQKVKDGTIVGLFKWNGGANQLWRIEPY